MTQHLPLALTLARIVIDFETRSEVSVADVGAYRYAEHPSTVILCFSWKLKGTDLKGTWVPGDPFPQALLDHLYAGRTFEAHNVPFERCIWFCILWKQLRIPVPTRWVDTLAACAYRAIPLGLDKVGPVLDLPIQKDKRGKYLLQQLSKPRKPRKAEKKEFEDLGLTEDEWPVLYNDDPELLWELYEYCETDVEAEDALGDTIGDLPPSEYRLWVLDQKINARGIAVDLELVQKARAVADLAINRMLLELQEITEGKVRTANQRDKLLEWLVGEGLYLENTQAATIEKAVARDDLQPHVKRVLQLRQSLSKNSISKLDSFWQCTCSDARLRGLLQYHGAGTGRWSGRLVQPQNFPRGSLEDYTKALGLKPAEVMELLIDCIKLGGQDAIDAIEMMFGDIMEALTTALRGCFVAGAGKRFVVADFSAIEAVVLAWLAGEGWKVEAFEAIQRGEPYNGAQDIYCATASMVFGYEVLGKKTHPKERQVGKTCELAFGYQGGVGAWYNFDDSGKYTEVEINGFKESWRERHPNTVALWHGLEAAAMDAMHLDEKTNYKSIAFEPVYDRAGKWLTCILPNGRRLWYFNPIVREVVKFGRKRMELTYEGRDNKRGGAWGRVGTYGGMLTENVVQAISRDLMAEAIIRVEQAGYATLLTVHDEIIAEVDDEYGSLEEFERTMALPVPPWAKGCPVAVDGWEGTRYMKA